VENSRTIYFDVIDLRDLSQWVSLDSLVEEMNDSDERIRGAAAYALGGVVAGSIHKYFPSLLEYLQRTTQPLERSLILHSIKEVRPLSIIVNARSSLSTLILLEHNCWVHIIS
jgi:hypothetical protein